MARSPAAVLRTPSVLEVSRRPARFRSRQQVGFYVATRRRRTQASHRAHRARRAQQECVVQEGEKSTNNRPNVCLRLTRRDRRRSRGPMQTVHSDQGQRSDGLAIAEVSDSMASTNNMRELADRCAARRAARHAARRAAQPAALRAPCHAPHHASRRCARRPALPLHPATLASLSPRPRAPRLDLASPSMP
jgi:hypothetical protein